MLRVLVVDDEPRSRELLRSLLEREPDIEVVAENGSGADAVEDIVRFRPDVVFLDIQLPDFDGFRVLERAAAAGQGVPEVVFVTAYDEFALQAFDVEAVDYLLKPFDEERLQQTLERVRSRRGTSETRELRKDLAELLATLGDRPLSRIAVKHGEESIVLRTEEIDWLEAEENYVRVHALERSYLVRATLQSLEDRLDPRRFVRLHRSTVVNVDRIRRLSPWGHGDLRILLDDGRSLRVSRRYRDRLDRVLEMLR